MEYEIEILKTVSLANTRSLSDFPVMGWDTSLARPSIEDLEHAEGAEQ